MKRTIILCIVLLTFTALEGQAQRIGAGDQENDPAGDSLKTDTTALHIKKWELTSDFALADSLVIDTTLRKLDIYRKLFQQNRFTHYLGNIGLGGLPMLFSNRPYQNRYLFGRYYEAYLPDAEDLKFYNTTTPYTVVNYHTSPRSRDKQAISALYTRNVRPGANVALQLSGHKSSGAYTRQNSGRRSYGASFNLLRQHYQLHGAAVHTRMNNMENGGITLDLSDPEDPLLTPNMDAANTNHIKQSILVNQTLRIGNASSIPDSLNQHLAKSWLDISHRLKFNRQSFVYKEQSASVNSFYNNMYFDSTATYDSTLYTNISNEIQLKLNDKWNQYFPMGVIASIKHQAQRFYNFKDFLETNAVSRFNNISVQAKAFNNSSKFYQWQAFARYHLYGYYQNDIQAGGNLQLQLFQEGFPFLLQTSFNYQQFTPSYFKQQYYANHHIWDKKLKQENRQEAAVKLHLEETHTTLKLRAIRHENYSYFDSAMHIQQFSRPITVLEGQLEQKLQWRHFHLDNKLFWQNTDASEALPLPELGYSASLYYRRAYFEVLNTQIGFNVQYHTAYALPAYDPATAQFHNQHNRQLSGNLPIAGFFANARWKRALLFLKFARLNFLLYDDTEYYYTVKQYPMPPMTFTFGVSWKFYD